MIYDTLDASKWFVVWFVVWFVLAFGVEVLAAVVLPWRTRGWDDPPPIAFGVTVALVATMVLAGLLGLVHWLTWLWVYGG